MTKPNTTDELLEAIATNLGLYYRESDGKWLREKSHNGEYMGVENMSAELSVIRQLIEAHPIPITFIPCNTYQPFNSMIKQYRLIRHPERTLKAIQERLKLKSGTVRLRTLSKRCFYSPHINE